MLKYIFILLFTLHFHAYGKAAPNAFLQYEVPDTTLVDVHLEHHELSAFSDSIPLSKEALMIVSDSLRRVGTFQLQKGDYDGALYSYEKSYHAAQKADYPKGLFLALNNMGATYRALDEYELALQNLFQAIELSKQFDLEYYKGMALSNIGRTYYELQNLNRAIAYIQESIAVSEVQKNDRVRHFAMLNLGRIYKDTGQADTALQVVDHLISLTDTTYKGRLGGALLEKGLILLEQEKYEQASENLVQSLRLFEIDDMQLPQARIYVNLAKAYFYQKKWQQAYDHLAKAKELAQTNGNNEVLMHYYQLSSQLHEREKKYLQALEEQRFYEQYKEKIFNKKKALKIDSLHLKLLTGKNEKLLSLKENEITFKRNIITLLIVITILVTLVTILVFGFYRVNRRSAKQLASKNKEIDLHKQALEKTNQQLETQVAQRTTRLKKVNQELNTLLYKSSHDLRSPTTTILGLAQLAKLDTKESLAADYFQMIVDTAGKNLKMLEKLFKATEIFNLELKLEKIDFGSLIKEIFSNLEKVKELKDLQLDLQVQEGLPFYSDKKLLSILFEQLIQNAVYFQDPAKATNQLQIKVAEKNQLLSIQVKDNGIGIPSALQSKVFDMFFKAHTFSEGHGIGLYLVSKVIEILGGEIEVMSAENTGTSFWMKLPFERELKND